MDETPSPTIVLTIKSQSNTSTPTVALAMCTGYILGAMIDVSLIRQRLCVQTERNSCPLVFPTEKLILTIKHGL